MGRLCPPARCKRVRGQFRPGNYRRCSALFGCFICFRTLGTLRDMQAGVKTILVIDDTEDVRNLIASVLTSYGFTAREAPNGQLGVQMIAEEKPDLVICDVNM